MIVVVMVGLFTLFTPRTSKAGMPVIDKAALANLIKGVMKEFVGDMSAWLTIDSVLVGMNADIAKWANNEWLPPWIELGGEGQSTFVENPHDFFKKVTEKVTENFIEEIQLVPSNEIITDNLAKVIEEVGRASLSKPTERLKIIGEGLTKEKLRSFTESAGDGASFTAGGGWQSWIDMTSNPENYVDGVILLAVTEMNQLKDSAVEQIKQELAQGGGFLTVRKCTEHQPGNPESDEFGCMGYTQVTPGSMIAERVGEIYTGDFDRLEQADEVTEMITGIIQSFINGAISSGLSNSDGRLRDADGNVIDIKEFKDKKMRDALKEACRDLNKMYASIFLNTSIKGREKKELLDGIIEQSNKIKCDEVMSS